MLELESLDAESDGNDLLGRIAYVSFAALEDILAFVDNGNFLRWLRFGHFRQSVDVLQGTLAQMACRS